MEKPIKLIVNPISGGHCGRELIHKISSQLKRLGLDADSCLTEAPGHAQELAQQAVAEGYDTIAIYGGDGTICEVLNGVVSSNVKLGLIPGGKGNDLALYLGIPARLEQACDIIGRGCLKKLDLARAGGRLFCTVGTIGLSAKVARRANEGSQGRLAYINYLFREILDFQPLPVHIEYPEGVYEGQVMLIAVGNTTCFGGGFKITPLASAEDGLLDICVIEPFTKLSLARRLPRVYAGRHLDYPFVKYWRTSRVNLSSPQPCELFADGEYFQALPVKLQAEPRAVSFFAPGNNET